MPTEQPELSLAEQRSLQPASRIFAFDLGAQVAVQHYGERYVGKIVSRLESISTGRHYAVHAEYKNGKGAEWFMEREVNFHAATITGSNAQKGAEMPAEGNGGKSGLAFGQTYTANQKRGTPA